MVNLKRKYYSMVYGQVSRDVGQQVCGPVFWRVGYKIERPLYHQVGEQVWMQIKENIDFGV